jgi:hypothetical protein
LATFFTTKVLPSWLTSCCRFHVTELFERFRADNDLNRTFVDHAGSGELTRQLLSADLDKFAVWATPHTHLARRGREAHWGSQPGSLISQLVEQFALSGDGAFKPVDLQLAFSKLCVKHGGSQETSEDNRPREAGHYCWPASAVWHNRKDWTLARSRLPYRLDITQKWQCRHQLSP